MCIYIYIYLCNNQIHSCIQTCHAENPVRLNLVASFVSRPIWHFHLAIAAHVTHGPLAHVDATIGKAVCPFTIHPESIKQSPLVQTPSSCMMNLL